MFLHIIIIFIFILIADFTWFAYSLPFYQKMVQDIQGTPLKVNMVYGTIAYIIIALSFYWFGIRNVDKKNRIISSVITGGAFGLASYGIFNFTNAAIFKNYPLDIALMDTLWGGFLGFITTYVISYI